MNSGLSTVDRRLLRVEDFVRGPMILLFDESPEMRAVARGLRGRGVDVAFESAADRSSMRAVRQAVMRVLPSAIVVGGGWNDRDAAERDPERAFRLNAENLIHVAAAALECHAVLVVLSTAEIFGGRGGPWTESDVPAPSSVWAESRYRGETFAMRASKGSIVVRTGPIISDRLESEHRELSAGPVEAADDEHVSPIGGVELGGVIDDLLRAGVDGVFHVAAPDSPVTRAEHWAELARLLETPLPVARRAGREGCPGPTRARNAALLPDKVRKHLSMPIRSWRDAGREEAARRGSRPVSCVAPDVFVEGSMTGHRQEVRRIEKPWGHEIIWAYTGQYVGKVLFVKAGERLSLQYHRVKDETIYVLSGKMVFEVGPKDKEREDLVMKPGDSYHITPETVHRMIALEDTHILEASTPELDDVVRLEDKYGRAGV